MNLENAKAKRRVDLCVQTCRYSFVNPRIIYRHLSLGQENFTYFIANNVTAHCSRSQLYSEEGIVTVSIFYSCVVLKLSPCLLHPQLSYLILNIIQSALLRNENLFINIRIKFHSGMLIIHI